MADSVGVGDAVGGLGRGDEDGGTELAAKRTATAPPTVTRIKSANTTNAAKRPAAVVTVAGRVLAYSRTVMLS